MRKDRIQRLSGAVATLRTLLVKYDQAIVEAEKKLSIAAGQDEQSAASEALQETRKARADLAASIVVLEEQLVWDIPPLPSSETIR